MNKTLLQQALDVLHRVSVVDDDCDILSEDLECAVTYAIQALSTELAKPDPEPVAVYRFSVPMQEYGVKWLITSELPDSTLLYVKEQL